MAKAESDLKSILDGGFDPHKFAWYEPELIEVPEPAKTLLEKYSKIPSEQVVDHVKKVVSHFPFNGEKAHANQYGMIQRDRAFAVVSVSLPIISCRCCGLPCSRVQCPSDAIDDYGILTPQGTIDYH